MKRIRKYTRTVCKLCQGLSSYNHFDYLAYFATEMFCPKIGDMIHVTRIINTFLKFVRNKCQITYAIKELSARISGDE